MDPPAAADVDRELSAVATLRLDRDVDLRERNRFGLGGAADLFGSTADLEALTEAIRICRSLDYPYYLLGEGSNVIVSDVGYRGLILRWLADSVRLEDDLVRAEAGASLQDLVDFTIESGRSGLHTLTRIPGSVGGAIYGNAGAYGHSIDESASRVRFLDDGAVREASNAECEFEYRESVFKRAKQRVILDCVLTMPEADPEPLRREAAEIRRVRDEKFPPTMRCAGSIFKNLYWERLPAEARAAAPPGAVRGGKIASAFFLERVGAKGMRRGGIAIADYHANIIFNAGGGTAGDLRALVAELKRRVRERFGFELEEEVQYLGEFDEKPGVKADRATIRPS